MKNNFTINENFVIDVNKNKLKNLQTSQEIKLEPRIINLLLLLVENQTKVLSREKAIEKVWQNYAGADDGLTQAISFLRKILDDKHKTIIKTIAKKGYIFEAIINENQTQNNASLPPEKSFFKKIFTHKNNIFIVFCLFLMAFLSYYYYQKNKNDGHEMPNSYFEELNKGAEEPKNKPK